MLKYFIELRVEGGRTVTIKCKDKADYEWRSKALEKTFPHLDWKERREH
jgi:hypothetical protein